MPKTKHKKKSDDKSFDHDHNSLEEVIDSLDINDPHKSKEKKSKIKTPKELVSKKKRRYDDDTYSLDLAYITPRIIAMGFPSVGKEAMYRNPMNKVQSFLKDRHDGHFMVYNLCSERDYNKEKFGGNVIKFPFDDHNCPPIKVMAKFCKHLDNWLKEHPNNVGVVHCKAGKGRTGVMICSYLLHCFWDKGTTVDDVLQFYGERRTYNGQGVTIPSQQAFIRYYGRTLSNPKLSLNRNIALSSMQLSKAPSGDKQCELWYNIKNGHHVYSSQEFPMKVRPESTATFDFGTTLKLNGEVRIEVFNKGKSLFYCWVHTAFMGKKKFTLPIERLDGKIRKKKSRTLYPESFEFIFTFNEIIKKTKNKNNVSTKAKVKTSSTSKSHRGERRSKDVKGRTKKTGSRSARGESSKALSSKRQSNYNNKEKKINRKSLPRKTEEKSPSKTKRKEMKSPSPKKKDKKSLPSKKKEKIQNSSTSLKKKEKEKGKEKEESESEIESKSEIESESESESEGKVPTSSSTCKKEIKSKTKKKEKKSIPDKKEKQEIKSSSKKEREKIQKKDSVSEEESDTESEIGTPPPSPKKKKTKKENKSEVKSPKKKMKKKKKKKNMKKKKQKKMNNDDEKAKTPKESSEEEESTSSFF